jgi:hypothetical protein
MQKAQQPLQCAISAGVILPFDVFNMAINGDIDKSFSYKEGVTCRHLLFEDTKHMISILRGAKSPKYSLEKMKTILNYLNFFQDDSYFILSSSDPFPALIKDNSSFLVNRKFISSFTASI